MKKKNKLHFISKYALSKSIHKSIVNRLRILARLYIYREKVDQVISFFSSEMIMLSIVERHPNIFIKIFRPYLFCDLTHQEKIDYLIGHYRYLRDNFSEKFIRTVYCDSEQLLLSNITDDEQPLDITLSYLPPLGKEGELTLAIYRQSSGERIYSIAFSFGCRDGKNVIIVGGIQGSDETVTDALGAIKNLTKRLNGLRPRNFLIFILRQISILVGVEMIIAVSSELHVTQCSHQKKGDYFKADYNLYWDEEHGINRGAFYEIPIKEERNDFTKIKSNKRAMYRRRYEMLDQYAIEITNSLKPYLGVILEKHMDARPAGTSVKPQKVI